MSNNSISIRNYAMQFGTILGVYYILKFILYIVGLKTNSLGFLFLILTLAVPFIGYYYGRMFRDKVLKGYIGFAQSWLFIFLMYIFASLLVAVAHYIYFQFIDKGFILETLYHLHDQFTAMNLPDMEFQLIQLKDNLDIISKMSVMDITLALFSFNMSFGSLVALPTALFVKRTNNTAIPGQQ